jgi:hypothetical protein
MIFSMGRGRRFRLAAAFAACASAALLRCGGGGSTTNDLPIFPGQGEGGKGMDASETVLEASDQPIDTGAPSMDSCATTSVPTFPDGWQIRGNASFLDAGEAQLVPARAAQAGAVFYGTAVDPEVSLDATYEIRIGLTDASGGPADGMTFAWIASSFTPGVGTAGGSLGFCGLVGGAAAIDVYQNDASAEGPVPALQLLSAPMPGDCTIVAHTMSPLTKLEDGKWHSLHYTWTRADNHSVVMVDGATMLDSTAEPPIPSGGIYLGFTAATGGAFAEFDVRNPVVTANACP